MVLAFTYSHLFIFSPKLAPISEAGLMLALTVVVPKLSSSVVAPAVAPVKVSTAVSRSCNATLVFTLSVIVVPVKVPLLTAPATPDKVSKFATLVVFVPIAVLSAPDIIIPDPESVTSE